MLLDFKNNFPNVKENNNKMKLSNPFSRRVQKINETSESSGSGTSMDTKSSDIEPSEEDYFLGFLGRNARKSIISITNNNLLEYTRKGSHIIGLKSKIIYTG